MVVISMGSIWSSAELDDQDDKWISDARYAMESGAFCVVCGAPFDIEGDVYNLDPKKPQCKWLSNLRLLGDFEALGAHRLTSGPSQPVNTSNEKDIFL
ncbi:hypothetical protein HBH98_095000 [Parastagonospora nodorum]|nr:hypothetical protein HBI04_097990 [Parastagonospora nodorum]KAH4347559.1 hypothetical protein HBH98_095000 [Parastagonospora nodorum]KAH4378694.1 hypothetical protein HBH99_202370 [Parastagonospora nodorum]KAH4600553.1 hypothetical protein HBH82_188130 [Parastagonospora nodorum]KAH4672099.1 hypothetical protein HBH78_176470 [Parastagonospora nodorum]